MTAGRRDTGTLRYSILRFVRNEATGGLVLAAAAAAAVAIANSAWSAWYFGGLRHPLLGLALIDWINDGLMALFFLVVAMEIKREILRGRLSTWSRRALPGLAALGGVAAPVLVYLAVNRGGGLALRGWAIPSATDIAFALGVASLLGSRVPPALKVLLMALAVIDDLIAILIIALFYTAEIDWLPLCAAAALVVFMAGLNLVGVRRIWPYALVGPPLWACVFLSGLHATLAGVAMGLAIPLAPSRDGRRPGRSPLLRLERALHPVVAFVVMPAFGFANAGIALNSGVLAVALRPIPLGVAAGLFLGKPIGVISASWIAIRLGLADLPRRVRWRSYCGVALLCGVGFTMSLFIGGLAFSDPLRRDEVKIGVMAGSLLSALAGWAVLASGPGRPRDKT